MAHGPPKKNIAERARKTPPWRHSAWPGPWASWQWQALVLVAASIWVFWPALAGTWLWDDSLLVTRNISLRSLHGLWNILVAPNASNYWPLTSTLFWIEWQLWGSQTLGYHLVTFALHLTSGFLLWRLFHRLGLPWAWLGAFLFLIHPLAVESVAWISETKNTLSLPFFLLSLLAWLDAEDGNKSGYFRSVLYYLLAMLAKTSTVMLPAVLLLYCWWKRARITSQELRRMLPYGAILAVLGVITVFNQSGHALDADVMKSREGLLPLLTAGAAVLFYLQKFLVPIDLLPIYPQNMADFVSVIPILALLLLLCALAFWWKQAAGNRHLWLGLGFFFVNLLPVVGILKMTYLNTSWVADHFVYLPMIGLVGLTVAGLHALYQKCTGAARPLAAFLVAALLVLLGSCAHAYAANFIDAETLWTYTLPHNPTSYAVHNNLGTSFSERGDLPRAASEFAQAAAIQPNDAKARINLGVILLDTNRVADAMGQFDKALQLNPNSAEANNNLGNALLRLDHVSESIPHYERALEIDPDYAEARNNLGNAYLQLGALPEARLNYERALKIDPDYPEAHNGLGVVLMETNHFPEAIAHYHEALRLNPHYPTARENLKKLEAFLAAHPTR